jgi:hypothetical protein
MNNKICNYLVADTKTLLKPKMRFVLVDWMGQVSQDLGLSRETYYYAVYVVDRYLSVKHLLEVKQLQLFGLTSLVLACKLEEIRPPSLSVMLSFCLNIYTDEDFKNCEVEIAQVL